MVLDGFNNAVPPMVMVFVVVVMSIIALARYIRRIA